MSSTSDRGSHRRSASNSPAPMRKDLVPSPIALVDNNQPLLFDDTKDLRESWPDLNYLSAPEAIIQENDESWEIESKDWRNHRDNTGKEYSRREHGRSVDDREITEGAALPQQFEVSEPCPRRHYGDNIALRQQSSSILVAPRLSTESVPIANKALHNSQLAMSHFPSFHSSIYAQQPSPTQDEIKVPHGGVVDPLEAVLSDGEPNVPQSGSLDRAHYTTSAVQKPPTTRRDTAKSQSEVTDKLDHVPSDADSDTPRSVTSEDLYAQSVFSIVHTEQTKSSSALDSIVSQDSAIERISAFFLADQQLRGLYDAAIEDPNIGAERFVKNFQRMLVVYSRELIKDTNDRTYYQAARFLGRHATGVAKSVCLQSGGVHASTPSPSITTSAWESDDGMRPQMSAADRAKEKSEKLHWTHAWVETLKQVSRFEPLSEVQATSPADDGYDDEESEKGELNFRLRVDELRIFLGSGQPIQNLRSKLKSFVTPKQVTLDPRGPEEEENPSTNYHPTSSRLLAAVFLHENFEDKSSLLRQCRRTTLVPRPKKWFGISQYVPLLRAYPGSRVASFPELTDRLFDAFTGYLPERPLALGKIRVRWNCTCGARLYDDFTELEPGSLRGLERNLRAMRGDHAQPEKQYTLASPVARLKRWGLGMRGWFNFTSKYGSNDTALPLHVDPHHTATPELNHSDVLHILCCIHTKDNGIGLHQERLSHVSTDKDLILFLRDVYEKRGRGSWLRLREVSRLLLSRFEVDFSSFVQVYLHEKACPPGDCNCLPSITRVQTNEYRCAPAPEQRPTSVPVLGENYLIHYFKRPDCLKEGQRTIFRQLPKRACGHLAASPDTPILGWGIYFQESWHWRSIYFIIVLLIVVASLVFGICWSIFKRDTQSAFTITSSWLTLGCLLLGYLALKSV